MNYSLFNGSEFFEGYIFLFKPCGGGARTLPQHSQWIIKGNKKGWSEWYGTPFLFISPMQ